MYKDKGQNHVIFRVLEKLACLMVRINKTKDPLK